MFQLVLQVVTCSTSFNMKKLNQMKFFQVQNNPKKEIENQCSWWCVCGVVGCFVLGWLLGGLQVLFLSKLDLFSHPVWWFFYTSNWVKKSSGGTDDGWGLLLPLMSEFPDEVILEASAWIQRRRSRWFSSINFRDLTPNPIRKFFIFESGGSKFHRLFFSLTHSLSFMTTLISTFRWIQKNAQFSNKAQCNNFLWQVFIASKKIKKSQGTIQQDRFRCRISKKKEGTIDFVNIYKISLTIFKIVFLVNPFRKNCTNFFQKSN